MKEQLTLGELIEKLEAIQSLPKEDRPEDVYFDFCNTFPDGVDSYRGFYNQLAVSWSGGDYRGSDTDRQPLKLKSFIELLKWAVGQEFGGWKGGTYTMRKDTAVWVSNPGCVSNTAVVGVKNLEWVVIIETEYQPD